ncbi:TPA: fimbrial protein [Citrobacter farmeri]|uniref:fimbrial protein n=1 Tax=Citrobacter farmeri TaxID=67824 RepID=UPI000F66B1CF|nr:fimbrial protein [Citrobacter farmeri]RSB16002.1 type 1 fimbrial protein [Citrobacter farmeri]
MKKSILGLAISAFFVVGAAQAETNPNDVSATLSVSGSVTASLSPCTVNLNQTSISLSADIKELVAQGATATPVNQVDMTISGDEQCNDLVSQGKMAYKFIGTADNALGTSLTNTLTGESAANGIGIALYNTDGQILSINKDTVTATTTPTHLGLGLVKLDGQEATAGSVQGSLTIQIERL